MEIYCPQCRYFYEDHRPTAYRRDSCCFCRCKGAFFSRNYRVGEGTRIGRNQPACSRFEPREQEDPL